MDPESAWLTAPDGPQALLDIQVKAADRRERFRVTIERLLGTENGMRWFHVLASRPPATACENVDTSQYVVTLSHMAASDRSRLIKLARRLAVITAADVAAAGIHSQQITRLVADGILERVSRGQYRLVERPITEHHSLVVAARAVPRGVICLLSALELHGIGTQLPHRIWIAIERGTRAPTVPELPLEVVRFSGDAFSEGIENHRIEGQKVRVYSIAKTVADLFKQRNKIGLDVALEALRESWRERKITMEALDRAARVCRVERVMRPYVEAIVA